jgi:hypothetical protein
MCNLILYYSTVIIHVNTTQLEASDLRALSEILRNFLIRFPDGITQELLHISSLLQCKFHRQSAHKLSVDETKRSLWKLVLTL